MHNDMMFESPAEFTEAVVSVLERQGWRAKPAPADAKGYDLEIRKGRKRYAVQVKHHKARVNVGQIDKFLHFLELPEASQFTGGYYISSSGFSNAAFTHLRTEGGDHDVTLGVFRNGEIVFLKSPPRLALDESLTTYVGVFTCKGGVGKTTVAAHLAGAFALMGHDVILVDIDRQGNLRKLLGDGVYLPGPHGQLGSTISVVDTAQWREQDYPEVRVVICDCNPVFEYNPPEFLRKFNYCIIPTSLTPLGINKNADVITRTFDNIRMVNKEAELFVLINNYLTGEERRNGILNEMLERYLAPYIERDERCHYINPEQVSIRFSKQLAYWGYHLVEEKSSQLAFREVAGRSYPRTDFLKLAEYLEEHTEIDRYR